MNRTYMCAECGRMFEDDRSDNGMMTVRCPPCQADWEQDRLHDNMEEDDLLHQWDIAEEVNGY